MGYAIVGYFDQDTDEKIRKLWKELALKGVDDYLYHSENNPHIKFAMYDEIDEVSVREEVRKLVDNIKEINVIFKSYSFYPNQQPFINIDLAVSMDLLELQAQIRNSCDPYAKLYPMDFFDQGIWKPDCQLTREIERNKLNGAIDCLIEHKLPLKGKLTRIGIIKFHPAKQLNNYELHK